MVSFFKDKSAVSVFWLILICFGLHVYSLIHAPRLSISVNDGFFYYLLQVLVNLQPYTLSVVYVLLVFLIALQINFVVNELNLLPKQSYTPALGFVLLSALLPQFNQVSTALFTCNFLIWIFFSVCRLYGKSNAKAAIYNVGFITGITVILYFATLPLIVIVLFSFLVMRPFRVNELFILIFGLITPLYFLVSFLFLTGNLKLLPLAAQLIDLNFNFKSLHFALPAITLCVAALVTVWGMIVVSRAGNRDLIQVRKSWNVATIFLIFLLPTLLFVSDAYPSAILIVFVPAACFIGYAFGSASRSILPIIFFWALAGLAIYNNWFAK